MQSVIYPHQATVPHYNDVIMSMMVCQITRRSMKTSKLRAAGLCAENPSVFPFDDGIMTNDISIEFEIQWNFSMSWCKIYSTNYNNNFSHVLQSVGHNLNQSTPNFDRISNLIVIPLVGRTPGLDINQCVVNIRNISFNASRFVEAQICCAPT